MFTITHFKKKKKKISPLVLGYLMDPDQRKKRKLDVLKEEGEEEEEEESETEEAKIEKFYELIRISKDIRARMMRINGERMNLEEEKTMEVMMIKNANKNKKKMKNVEREKSSVGGGAWNPTFQPEDFLEDGFQFKVNILAAPSSNSKKQQEAADDDGEGRGDHNNNNNGLDLNLSL